MYNTQAHKISLQCREKAKHATSSSKAAAGAVVTVAGSKGKNEEIKMTILQLML